MVGKGKGELIEGKRTAGGDPVGGEQNVIVQSLSAISKAESVSEQKTRKVGRVSYEKNKLNRKGQATIERKIGGRVWVPLKSMSSIRCFTREQSISNRQPTEIPGLKPARARSRRIVRGDRSR